jgi:hypothetical protein
LHREGACLSPACDRHLIGEFLKIERTKDAAVSCVEETKKAPTVDDCWALVVSLSSAPRGLGKRDEWKIQSLIGPTAQYLRRP